MSEVLPTEKNRFGRWMEAMNYLLGTTYAQVARRIGVTRGALSQSIYGNGGVKPETALAIMEWYSVLIQQQGMPISDNWKSFFLLSWFRGGEAISQADMALRHMEFVADLKRERDRLQKQNSVLAKGQLARDYLALLEENERLKGEIERLKGEAEDS